MDEFNTKPLPKLHVAASTDELVRVISQDRLNSLCSGCCDTPLMLLHQRNIELSEALYPCLHMLEIVVRNRIHAAFSTQYGTEYWFDQPWLAASHARMVVATKAKILARGEDIASETVVSALTFGFWSAMFTGAYECSGGPWPHALRLIAPAVPKAHRTRARLSERVEQARALRNRVFHHVPIVQRPDLYERHRAMVELLGWLSPEAREHLAAVCRFRSVLANPLASGLPLP
jgi:hypothetical protein